MDKAQKEGKALGMGGKNKREKNGKRISKASGKRFQKRPTSFVFEKKPNVSGDKALLQFSPQNHAHCWPTLNFEKAKY